MTHRAHRCDEGSKPKREIDGLQVERSLAVTMEEGGTRWT